jgi:hypothetical protein
MNNKEFERKLLTAIYEELELQHISPELIEVNKTPLGIWISDSESGELVANITINRTKNE